MNITKNLIVAVLMTIVTTLLLGVVYPLVVTGLAQVLFPRQGERPAASSATAKVIGSRIIGQAFSSPGYFRSRPSAAGTGYDPLNSGGTNLGPTNKKLIDAVKAAVDAAKKENPSAPVPIDLVTSSASGLDPHISPAAALVPGAARGARARECRRTRSGGWWTRTRPDASSGFSASRSSTCSS